MHNITIDIYKNGKYIESFNRYLNSKNTSVFIDNTLNCLYKYSIYKTYIDNNKNTHIEYTTKNNVTYKIFIEKVNENEN